MTEGEVDLEISVLTNVVAMSTHVFPSTPVGFVVVLGDEVPGDKSRTLLLARRLLHKNGHDGHLEFDDEFPWRFE